MTLALTLSSACQEAPQRFSTRVQVTQLRSFGAAAGPKLTDLEVKYVECPADARHVMRLGKELSACGAKLKVGDEIAAEVRRSWSSERRVYRSEIVRLGDCDVKLDPTDEANHQTVEVCTDVKLSGAVVGVRCDRTRGPELIAKCPWLAR